MTVAFNFLKLELTIFTEMAMNRIFLRLFVKRLNKLIYVIEHKSFPTNRGTVSLE